MLCSTWVIVAKQSWPRHTRLTVLCVMQVISMIKSSALCGSAIIAYLQAKGYPEVSSKTGAGQDWHGRAWHGRQHMVLAKDPSRHGVMSISSSLCVCVYDTEDCLNPDGLNNRQQHWLWLSGVNLILCPPPCCTACEHVTV